MSAQGLANYFVYIVDRDTMDSLCCLSTYLPDLRENETPKTTWGVSSLNRFSFFDNRTFALQLARTIICS
jgi:hypothetical protein